MHTTVRALTPDDAAAFQALRLRALLECPAAFASSHDEEVDTPLTEIAARLRAGPDGAIFGLHDPGDGGLTGVVGLHRERMRKLAHNAHLWGMYVAPAARRGGAGRALVAHALAHASGVMRVRQVTLGVETRNSAAIALYRAMGFVSYGLQRGFLLVGGELHDEWLMAWTAPGASPTAPRPMRTCTGSCHCGAVRFEVDTDFPELTTCDCSICRRKNALMVKVHESRFRLVAGEGALTEYRFHTRTARHFFCRICGIYPFHRKRVTPDFVGVNVHCLHDADLQGIPVRPTAGASTGPCLLTPSSRRAASPRRADRQDQR